MFLDRYPVACVLQPRMSDPLSRLKSTLVIQSPLFSTTNLLLQVTSHVFELITISPYWKVRFMNTKY